MGEVAAAITPTAEPGAPVAIGVPAGADAQVELGVPAGAGVQVDIDDGNSALVHVPRLTPLLCPYKLRLPPLGEQGLRAWGELG